MQAMHTRTHTCARPLVIGVVGAVVCALPEERSGNRAITTTLGVGGHPGVRRLRYCRNRTGAPFRRYGPAQLTRAPGQCLQRRKHKYNCSLALAQVTHNLNHAGVGACSEPTDGQGRASCPRPVHQCIVRMTCGACMARARGSATAACNAPGAALDATRGHRLGACSRTGVAGVRYPPPGALRRACRRFRTCRLFSSGASGSVLSPPDPAIDPLAVVT